MNELTRRSLFQLGAVGAAAWGAAPPAAEYLTSLNRIKPGGRGNPPPSKLPPEKFREAGLVPETWRLEVVADPDSKPAAEIERPLTLDWNGLMRLAEEHTVRFLHVCTCTNVADPFHMCLWEGVPLREVVWMTKPKANLRRAYYWGYTTENSKRFQSSLALDRILEDPPGELPVILAYKMNGQPIPVPLGGPVRLIVPGAYANRSIKWLQHVVLTNDFQANDSYAQANNDVESTLKTQARFVDAPTEIPAGKSVAVTGIAQVGMSGLRKVQYSAQPKGAPRDWKEATILPPPKDWGGGLPGGKLPGVKTDVWPMRYALAQWTALLPALRAGQYDLCCRTIDANGIAQPMPRPLPRTGLNTIQQVALLVKDV